MDGIFRAVVVLTAALSLWVPVASAGETFAGGDAQQLGYQALYAQLERTDAVQEGAKVAKHVLFVFFDANCLYCHLTWKALQPYEKVGLQVRWVPVAYQQPSSTGRAAAIMQAPDRVAALRENEAGYHPGQFTGGIAPLDRVPGTLMAQLRANTQLMQEFGAPGTPALVWKDRVGQVRFKLGVPRLSELPRITQLSAQHIDDPELARFR
ncbi:MAG: thioredoxin fold domain-containing protein [Thiobacillaceae bacterium]